MKRAVILDTSAMIYRSHFALMNMRNSKGMPTGATYGFVNTIEGLIKELEPDYLVACLDVKRNELKRSEELESYKAHRESMPEDLVEQIDSIMDVLDGYKIPKYKVMGYEADDVISTLATKFSEDENEEIEVYIVTGDKDLSQLVNGKINIALLGKGDKKSMFKYVRNEADVIENLGVTPDKIPDLFGLMGDASDGIPGVAGIGPKTGVKLITEYGDLETLYENIDEIKGKMKEKLIKDRENAFLSRKLATVYKDVEVEYNKDKLKVETKNLELLLEIYKKMEFKKFSSNIENEMKKLGKLSSTNTKKDNNDGQISLFANMNEELEKIKIEKVDEKIEALNIDKFVQKIAEINDKIGYFENNFGIAVSEKKATYIYLKNGENINKIYESLTNKEIVGYNIKELLKNNNKLTNYFDVMLAWYVLGTESSQDLENIIFSELGENIEKFEDQFKKRKIETIEDDEKKEFIAKRSSFLYELKSVLKERLENEGLYGVYNDLEIKLVPVLAEMEKNGIKIDKKYFEIYGKELEKNILELEEKIYELSGEKFNIGSPKQLSEILFEKMMIEPVKKTKTGYSTDVEVLETLAERGIEIAEKLLEYRGYTKLLSTYVDPLPKLADENSRIHTSFNQNGTATGRLSSSNPNVQNIPTRTEEGTKIRNGFVAEDGWSLISFDYSQIELRVLAELSKDENLILAYQKDRDLHDLTARRIFYKMEEEEVSKFERSVAKVINFSILYGKTSFGLSKELKIPLSDASQYIKAYFEQYPKVKQFLDNVLEEAQLNGFVETLYGTRRYISGINSSNKNIKNQANRMAVNTVVQGTAANIIKMVMIELFNKFKNDNDIKMLLQVHDELIFEVKDEAVEKYMIEIKNIMENSLTLENVKLKANGEHNKNWGELK